MPVITVSGIAGCEVHWTEGWIQSKGFGVPPKNAVTEDEAKLAARQAALCGGLRGIVACQGFLVEEEVSTMSILEGGKGGPLEVSVAGTVVGASSVPELEAWIVPVDGDWLAGYYEVTMRCSLPDFVKSVLAILPPSIASLGDRPGPATSEFTALILDARDIFVSAPILLLPLSLRGRDEDPFALAAPRYAVAETEGDSDPFDALVDAFPIGENPLVVRPLAASGSTRSLIVSEQDATLITEFAARKGGLLASDGSVIVLLGGPIPGASDG